MRISAWLTGQPQAANVVGWRRRATTAFAGLEKHGHFVGMQAADQILREMEVDIVLRIVELVVLEGGGTVRRNCVGEWGGGEWGVWKGYGWWTSFRRNRTLWCDNDGGQKNEKAMEVENERRGG